MTLTPAFLDELRARTVLSTLIGRSIKVQKAGREYKACCPFHNEKTPSFTINDEKGFYHCFGCGAHGDAIRWMTDQRGLPFIDAVKELADAAGIDLPAPDPRAARKAEAAKTLHDVMTAAQGWYAEQLNGLAGAEARAYLDRRGITDATRAAFGFGFAPDSRSGIKTALKAFDEALLVEAGLLIKPEGDRDSYDRFRGRLMIPIRDARGRVIAFGGRLLGPGEPKYLNSPDTPLFDKGRTLYNLDKAASVARKSGRMIVVEGYMDVVALAQAGFGECVAPLGTALTEAQIERLWSMVDEPLLCFDGDSAGQKAAVRAANRALPLLRPGHSLAFLTLPAGQDPDDLVRSKGAAAFATAIEGARPLIETLWAHELAAAPLDTPERRAGLKQRLDALIGAIQHPDVRPHYGHAFHERYRALFFQRQGQGANAHRPRHARAQGPQRDRRGFMRPIPPPPPSDEARAVNRSGTDAMMVRAITAGLLRHPALLRSESETLYRLPLAGDPAGQLIQTMLQIASATENVETDGLITILANTPWYNSAKELLRADMLHFTFTRDCAEPARARDDLVQAIRAMVEMPEIEAELARLTGAMGDSTDEALFHRQQTLSRLRGELLSKLARLAQADDLV